ncbi:MAG: DUF2029 domain-containing protein [Anaerolineae bacterium]|nr:DUF2029 domain-containing protein [Anaerolineae bacterium]
MTAVVTAPRAHSLRRLIPSAYRADPFAGQLARALLLALLLRLLFMPFAAHNDYLSEHWVAARIAFLGDLYPSPDQLLSHYLDAAFLWLVAPVVPAVKRLLLPPAELGAALHASPLHFLTFAADPAANRVLFVTKLPYLAADLAGARVLLSLADRPEEGVRAWCWWLLNPFSLFATYIYGRQEPYGLLLVGLATFYMLRDRIWRAALFLGLAVSARVTPLALAPLLVGTASKRWRERAGLVAVIATSAAAMPLLLQGVLGLKASVVVSGDRELLPGMWNAIGSTYPVYVFFVLYGLLLIVAESLGGARPRFLELGAISYMLMFALTWQSVHYYCWALPFVVPLLARGRLPARLYVSHMATWAGYWCLAGSSGVFSLYLLSPLSTSLCCLTGAAELVAELLPSLPPDRLVVLLRSGLTATSLACAACLAMAMARDWLGDRA